MKLTIWMLCGEVSREQEQKRKGQLGESGGSSSWDVCLGLPPGGGGGGKGWRLGCAGRARQTGLGAGSVGGRGVEHALLFTARPPLVGPRPRPLRFISFILFLFKASLHSPMLFSLALECIPMHFNVRSPVHAWRKNK